MSHPDDRQLHDVIAEARAALDALEKGIPTNPTDPKSRRGQITAYDLLRQPRTDDGYPRTTLNGSTSPTGSHSDPVANIITAGYLTHAACNGEGCPNCQDGYIPSHTDPDTTRTHALTVIRSITTARNHLRTAVNTLAKTQPPTTHDPQQIWCRHHLANGHHEPIGDKGRDGLCRWCHDFRATERTLPTRKVLEHRAIHGRITTTKLDELMPNRPTKQHHNRARR